MENNLELYFAQLEAQLSDLPAARRAEFVAEARAHLAAMIEARRADGLSEQAACAAAMREFGAPNEVGRALREQWANGAQLESEGAPLTLREMARRLGVPLIFGIVMALLIGTFGSPLMWHGAWVMPVVTVYLVGFLGRGIWKRHREGGPWTASAVLGIAFAVIVNAFALGTFQWGADWGTSLIESVGTTPVMIGVYGLAGLIVWLGRRERVRRPWQFASNFKSNPIAAEQEYKLRSVVGGAMGAMFAVLAFLLPRFSVFGIAASWPVGIALIGAVLAVGWWPQGEAQSD